jgi:hypothetical protein
MSSVALTEANVFKATRDDYAIGLIDAALNEFAVCGQDADLAGGLAEGDSNIVYGWSCSQRRSGNQVIFSNLFLLRSW